MPLEKRTTGNLSVLCSWPENQRKGHNLLSQAQGWRWEFGQLHLQQNKGYWTWLVKVCWTVLWWGQCNEWTLFRSTGPSLRKKHHRWCTNTVIPIDLTLSLAIVCRKYKEFHQYFQFFKQFTVLSQTTTLNISFSSKPGKLPMCLC